MSRYALCLGSTVCFALMTMSLFLCVFLYFIPTRDHVTQGTCTVTNCQVLSKICHRQSCSGTTKERHCTTDVYTCYSSTVQIELDFGNGTVYYGTTTENHSFSSSAYSRCDRYPDGKQVKCYYDDRNPGSSLSLKSTGPLAGPIASVVIFTIFAFACLITCIISAFVAARS
jgi:hypothetical protein